MNMHHLFFTLLSIMPAVSYAAAYDDTVKEHPLMQGRKAKPRPADLPELEPLTIPVPRAPWECSHAIKRYSDDAPNISVAFNNTTPATAGIQWTYPSHIGGRIIYTLITKQAPLTLTPINPAKVLIDFPTESTLTQLCPGATQTPIHSVMIQHLRATDAGIISVARHILMTTEGRCLHDLQHGDEIVITEYSKRLIPE